MAILAPTIRAIGGGAVLIEWPALAAGDSGDWISLTEYRDKTVQMTGGPAAAVIQGTNDPAKASPVTLFDVDNTTTLTQAALAGGVAKVIKENPLYIRPVITTGPAATVRITGRR